MSTINKKESKERARKHQIISATLTAMVNSPDKLESHKKAFKEDETIEDKSPDSFLDWMVENINPGVRFNIVKSQLVIKKLPDYGEVGVSNSEDGEIEF